MPTLPAVHATRITRSYGKTGVEVPFSGCTLYLHFLQKVDDVTGGEWIPLPNGATISPGVRAITVLIDQLRVTKVGTNFVELSVVGGVPLLMSAALTAAASAQTEHAFTVDLIDFWDSAFTPTGDDMIPSPHTATIESLVLRHTQNPLVLSMCRTPAVCQGSCGCRDTLEVAMDLGQHKLWYDMQVGGAIHPYVLVRVQETVPGGAGSAFFVLVKQAGTTADWLQDGRACTAWVDVDQYATFVDEKEAAEITELVSQGSYVLQQVVDQLFDALSADETEMSVEETDIGEEDEEEEDEEEEDNEGTA